MLIPFDLGDYHLSVEGDTNFEMVTVVANQGASQILLRPGVKNHYSAGTAMLWNDGGTNAFEVGSNYILLSDNSDDILTTIVHEIHHTPIAGSLNDLVDCPDNLMYYQEMAGKYRLKFRELKRKDGVTPGDHQWKMIHGQ
jgi:hypothetical protein